MYPKLGDITPEGTNLDMTQDGKLAGIEILDASKKINISTLLSWSLELDKDILKSS